MALNFPPSPLLNDIYTYSGKSWKWDGTSWVSISASENSANKVDRGLGSTRTGVRAEDIGKDNDVSGDYAFAQGDSNIASGQGSSAFGTNNTASGLNSHVEGDGDTESGPSVASGWASHAEGIGTWATGIGSHSEGMQTLAGGHHSHTEGFLTEANGENSHAGGQGTIASGTNQTVIGKYNVENADDGPDGYAFIIGNGSPPSDGPMPSNALAVTWSGDIYSATGKQLSQEDFTTDEKTALANKLDKIFITNLVTNGDFQNTNGWVGVNSTLSVNNSTLLSVVADPASSWLARSYYDTNTNMLANHKYYISCQARVTTADCYAMDIQLRTPGLVMIDQIITIMSPVENQWYNISAIKFHATESNGMMFYAMHEYLTEIAAGLGQMEMQNVIIIDLTDAFGATNEPIVSEMDQLISYYNNNYVSTADNSYISSQHDISDLRDALIDKVDKVAGMGLSSNDYTTPEKELLASLSNTNMLGELTEEPTGFTNNSSIDIVYDSTEKTITLNGTFQAYYQGILIEELVNGWVSDPHPDTYDTYFLYYNGTSFIFDNNPWLFEYLQIAFVQYSATHKFAARETHGFMPNVVHKNIHQTIGTYKTAGGDFSSFIPNSTTAVNRRPDISSTTVADEDLQSVIGSLTSKTYTQRYLTGSAVRTITTGAAEIVPVNGNEPYWNRNIVGVWSQQLFNNGEYGAIFVIAVPTTSDAGSTAYRYMFVQPQQVSSSLTTIQALSPTSLVLGDNVLFIAEFVFVGKIIIRRASNNWHITEISKLDGTKISQVAYIANNALTTVNVDTTLTGDGTAASPLSVVLSNSFDLSTPIDWDTIKYNPVSVKWEAKPDSFVHTQNIVSDTWVIEHNLHKYPSVHVFDSFNLEAVGSVVHNSLIQMTITFTGSFSGVAYLN
jgi:hypothetical protein